MTADWQILGMAMVITMNVAGLLTTRRTDPRFGECASSNHENGPILGNVLDLKTSKSKLKHLVREAPGEYGLEE